MTGDANARLARGRLISAIFEMKAITPCTQARLPMDYEYATRRRIFKRPRT